MNALTTQSPPPFNGSALRIELAKMLGLVAPITMSADQCTLWLASAEDALEDIRPSEVKAISAELRRTVTRPAQIVPEIARLVAEKRKRSTSGSSLDAINAERVKSGLDAVHWVTRDGTATIEAISPPRNSIGVRVR